jgi:hypothetical protein
MKRKLGYPVNKIPLGTFIIGISDKFIYEEEKFG